jgi:hypothetical protein
MTIQKGSTSGLVIALGGLLVGLPAASALAAEPTTAAEAQALVQKYCDRADNFRSMGGFTYKQGLVQDAEAQAARNDALAQKLAAPSAGAVTSPEAQHYADLAESYRAKGGVAYKTGLVQRAEADEQKYERAPATTQANPCDR